MWILNSRSNSAVAALVCLSFLLWSPRAEAQACCAGGGAFAPARLKLYEDALVGVQLKVNDDLGSFDGTGAYSPNPPGASELDLEEDVVGAIRINSHIQVGVVVPILETRRTIPGYEEMGGGLGDITVHARFDLLLPTDHRYVPGVALVAAVTAPSGRPPEEAHTILATGATGTGFWQGAVGVAVEELIGRWVLDAGASLWDALPRKVSGTTELLGLQVTGRFAFGYAFHGGSALALTLSYKDGTNSVIDGAVAPETGQEFLTAGLAAGLPLNSEWRLQAAISDDLPVVGRNHVAGVGGTLTVLRTF